MLSDACKHVRAHACGVTLLYIYALGGGAGWSGIGWGVVVGGGVGGLREGLGGGVGNLMCADVDLQATCPCNNVPL